MVKKDNVYRAASEYAKDIVVSTTSNLEIKPCDETGKDIADFYKEIFKGISESLLETLETYEK